MGDSRPRARRLCCSSSRLGVDVESEDGRINVDDDLGRHRVVAGAWIFQTRTVLSRLPVTASVRPCGRWEAP